MMIKEFTDTMRTVDVWVPIQEVSELEVTPEIVKWVNEHFQAALQTQLSILFNIIAWETTEEGKRWTQEFARINELVRRAKCKIETTPARLCSNGKQPTR